MTFERDEQIFSAVGAAFGGDSSFRLDCHSLPLIVPCKVFKRQQRQFVKLHSEGANRTFFWQCYIALVSQFNSSRWLDLSSRQNLV